MQNDQSVIHKLDKWFLCQMQKTTKFNTMSFPLGLLHAINISIVNFNVKRCKSDFNDFSMGSLDEPGAIHVVVVSL